MRTIKPEFWTDSRIVALGFVTRLFYIGAWNFADDQGCLPDNPAELKMQIFPADTIDVTPLIEELVQSGRLVRWETTDGDRILEIAHFREHQKIDHPAKPRFSDRDSWRRLSEILGKISEPSEKPASPRAGIGKESSRVESIGKETHTGRARENANGHRTGTGTGTAEPDFVRILRDRGRSDLHIAVARDVFADREKKPQEFKDAEHEANYFETIIDSIKVGRFAKYLRKRQEALPEAAPSGDIAEIDEVVEKLFRERANG